MTVLGGRRGIGVLLLCVGLLLLAAGGWFNHRRGIVGQLTIPEGGESRAVEQPGSIISIRWLRSGGEAVFPVSFAAHLRHPVRTVLETTFDGQPATFTVDRYLPNAHVTDEVRDDGAAVNPAVQIIVRDDEGEEEHAWFFAQDPNRFGAQWGDVRLMFMDAQDDQRLRALLGLPGEAAVPARGTLRLTFAGGQTAALDVAQWLGQPVPVAGTPYTVTIRDYFPDLAVADAGVVNRSQEPRNPAVAFTVQDGEDTEAHLALALHPAFAATDAQDRRIPVQAVLEHPTRAALPPSALVVVRGPDGRLWFVATSPDGQERHHEPLTVGRPHATPWVPASLEVTAVLERARIHRQYGPAADGAGQPVIHGTLAHGGETVELWLPFGSAEQVPIGGSAAMVAYQPAVRELPFTVALKDVRSRDAADAQTTPVVESDIELRDPARGVVLTRTITPQQPLTYRGVTVSQEGYGDEPVEMTVLAVRSAPGRPIIYAGCLIAILGLLVALRRPGNRATLRGA